MIETLKSPWAGEDTLRALARPVALDVSRGPLCWMNSFDSSST